MSASSIQKAASDDLDGMAMNRGLAAIYCLKVHLQAHASAKRVNANDALPLHFGRQTHPLFL